VTDHLTPQRWRRIEQLYHDALPLEPAERARHLKDACGGDELMRGKVEALLLQASDTGLLQPPLLRIGGYQLGPLLGVGGMGEVYRAYDTELRRDVAVKILPREFHTDRDRIVRFEREALALAALNHPNIATIYGVEQADGFRAIVMELIEGETLGERIARAGSLPVEEAVRYAQQIADGLDAAHEKGIVHRDLKPGNIKITPEGVVKLLDFGLATARVAAAAGDTLETAPDAGVTREGAIVGTVAYMSPEQARGQAVDKRTDIWAFGCVMYEMLTGQPAFAGATVFDSIAAILGREPDWSVLPAGTPTGIQRLLRRCLEKDARRRLRDIGDVRVQIEEGLTEPAGTAGVGAPSRSRERMWWAGALIVTGVVAAGTAWAVREPNRPLDEVRLELNTPPTLEATSLAISPDGKTVAFVATSDGQSRLWLRELAIASMRPLPGTENARFPFWSPDSRSIAFAADGQLKRVDIKPGIVRMVASGGALGGAWNRDGTILYDRFAGTPLYRVSAEGGNPEIATKLSTQANDPFAPQFLPDHRHFLFYATGTEPGVYLDLLGGSDPPRRILDAQAAAYAASGHLLFVRGGTLYAQPFDPVQLQLTGTPTPIAEQVPVSAGVAALSTSAAGPIVYRTGPSGAQHHLVWFDRHGTPLETVAGSDFGTGSTSALSPDGRRVAVSRTSGTSDIWLIDIRRGIPFRLTDDPAFDLGPLWSPDGRRIAFTSNRRGTNQWGLYMKAVDRAEPEEVLVNDGTSPTDWSADGRVILYEVDRGPQPQRDVWALPVERPRTPFPVLATRFNETSAQFSPRGEWIAYQSDASGQTEIYVQPFSASAPANQGMQITNGGGVRPRWRGDGKELFYLAPDSRLMGAKIDLDARTGSVEVRTPVPLFTAHLAVSRGYTVSKDGQRFLIDAATEVTLPITVLLNLKPR
jgi:Tol biopolymer transport system component